MSPEPLGENAFDRLMRPLGPFEAKPHVAVAVSGGADSMALTLLADRWSRRRGGRLTALSVDHGLRPGSADEARRVGGWLSRHGIEHRILTWAGSKPASGVQAAARAARYDLLKRWCRQAGVLHLLLAHHRQDQAETFLLRLKRDSGVDGLAAMSAAVETPYVRLLRPLLSIDKEQLTATLEEASQPWLEDPSNENRAFERVRIRQALPSLAAGGVTPPDLAKAAARMARARVALEAAASGLLARCCFPAPSGFVRMDGGALFAAPEEISLRGLSRVLMSVGGGEYPPRLKKLERLHENMKAASGIGGEGWKGATLARCRVLRQGAGGFLICREDRFLPPPMPVADGVDLVWDNRFRIRIEAENRQWNHGVTLQPLGLIKAPAEERLADFQAPPAPALASLPALVDAEGLLAAPHLNYRRAAAAEGLPGFAAARFRPRQSLSGTGFLVAE